MPKTNDKPMYLGDLVNSLDYGFGRVVTQIEWNNEVFDVPSDRYYERQYDVCSIWEVHDDPITGDKKLYIK